MTKIKRAAFSCLLPAAALIIEILPLGAVCKFADGPDGAIIKTYSYFSLTPFGYANFFPLPAGILTAVMLLSGVLSLIKPGKKLLSAQRWIAAAAFIASLLPIVYGAEYLNLFGIIVSVLLLAQSLIALTRKE